LIKLLIILSFAFTVIGAACKTFEIIETKEVVLTYVKNDSDQRYEHGEWITIGKYIYTDGSIYYSFSHYHGKVYLYDERK
jgi:hypothetical protein